MTRNCLVVDDSRVVRKVARRILEARGFAVAPALRCTVVAISPEV